MKKLYFILLFFFFFLLVGYLNVGAEQKTKMLKNKIITIDPGHGGRDSGTRYGKLLEKDFNLEVSKVLKEELEAYGATVYLIRDEDIDFSKDTDSLKKRGDLKRRIQFIEAKKSDLYLSIHMNWYSNSYYGGTEVLYSDLNSKNLKLAEALTNSFLKSNIRTREIRKTDLYLYNHTKTVGVLLECGFLSNPDDRYLFQKESFQKKFSTAVLKGVIHYFNL